MKYWLAAVVAGLSVGIAGAAAGQELLSGEDAVANVVLGQCLSEVSHTPLPPGSLTGFRPVSGFDRVGDPRLSSRAMRVPSRRGVVNLDHDGEVCEVIAGGIRPHDVATRLQALFVERGLPARAVAADPAAANGDSTQSFTVGSPGQASTTLITLRYIASQPHNLTVRVTSTRQINVTEDSAAGWTPSAAQAAQAEARMRAFFAALDGGQYEQAFAMMAPVNRQVLVFADWSAQMQEFNAMAGAVRDHRMSSITWTRDPAGAPLPGVYAAIDLTSHYANVDRNCGYIILYQAPAGGDFQVMRVESNYLDNAHAQAIIESGPGANIDDIWAQLAASCPNYQP